MEEPATQATAGWYIDPAGVVRWWTGSDWGPIAPTPRPGAADGHVLASLSHGGLFMLYFVGPLVIRQTAGKSDPFVRRHATEALNAQITFGLVWNAFGLPGIYGGLSPWIFLGGMAAAFCWILITSLVGVRRAWTGRAWRYPCSLRFVPGGFARASAGAPNDDELSASHQQ